MKNTMRRSHNTFTSYHDDLAYVVPFSEASWSTVTRNKLENQSEHIGQWATPHHRRLGGIGRVFPIVRKHVKAPPTGAHAEREVHLVDVGDEAWRHEPKTRQHAAKERHLAERKPLAQQVRYGTWTDTMIGILVN